MEHDANTPAVTPGTATPAPANPLLAAWQTPYGLPPFDAVRPEHFLPAFEQALREHRDELDAIAANPAAPDFDNTVAAFDRSGRLMTRLAGLFFNLASSETSPALQAVERELAPRLAEHDSAIYLNAALFARIDAVHAQRSGAAWTSEQRRMAERVHLDFVRAGARLAPEARRRHAELKLRLATLQTQFGQNVLADEAAFRLELRGEDDLAGLPGFVRAAAREAARERRSEADGVITLSRSHIVPFLTFSERADLREQAWRAWTTRGERDGEHDNRSVAGEILALRQELARLHDKASYADFALADTMAGTQAAVDRLLERVWQPALARAQSELEALRGVRLAHGQSSDVEPWDWRYLAEKVRQARFGIEEAAIKPYFPLERMVEAMFECAHRLFGLRFVAQPQVRAYHPDVQVYEVQDAASGRLVGVFLHDNFARPTKRSGAWMSSYREQSRHGGGVLPIVVNNNNFAKGAPG
ncbi:MAG TPA: M3 family metallopeptidase, partial [Burkholderiaceae bacterium]|nr:M3 family metallopeptidase [Burkholderiaceae bacterium]